MATMTITEGLAEIKLIERKIAKKVQQICQYVAVPATMKDPLEKTGGSPKMIQEEWQAINDLLERKANIRRAVQHASDNASLKIGDIEGTITSWLVWRRDVAPTQKDFQDKVRRQVEGLRAKYHSMNPPVDVSVFLNEDMFNRAAEQAQGILDALDGQLSLKNATTTIDI